MFKSFAAVAVSVAALVLGGAAAANASTSGVLPFNSSNTVVNANGVDFFQAVNPGWNSPVTAGPANTSDNNFAVQVSGPNSVRFNLVGTNLCVADPGPGYGHVDAVVLRTCNGKQWQAFTVTNRQPNGLGTLQSVATNQFITDNGQFNALTSDADNRPCAVGHLCVNPPANVNTFDGSTDQLWRFGHNRFFPRPQVSATQSQSSLSNGLNSSVTYSYDVVNHGNVNANVGLSATEVATVTVDGVGVPAGTATTAGAGTYHLSFSQNLQTSQLVPAHSSVVDTNNLTLASHGSTTTVTGPNGYEDTLAHFAQQLGAQPHVHVAVQLVETPTVTANFGGHFTHNVNVTPATETVNF